MAESQLQNQALPPGVYYVPPPDEPPNMFAGFLSNFLALRNQWGMELFRARLAAMDPSKRAGAMLRAKELDLEYAKEWGQNWRTTEAATSDRLKSMTNLGVATINGIANLQRTSGLVNIANIRSFTDLGVEDKRSFTEVYKANLNLQQAREGWEQESAMEETLKQGSDGEALYNDMRNELGAILADPAVVQNPDRLRGAMDDLTSRVHDQSRNTFDKPLKSGEVGAILKNLARDFGTGTQQWRGTAPVDELLDDIESDVWAQEKAQAQYPEFRQVMLETGMHGIGYSPRKASAEIQGIVRGIESKMLEGTYDDPLQPGGGQMVGTGTRQGVPAPPGMGGGSAVDLARQAYGSAPALGGFFDALPSGQGVAQLTPDQLQGMATAAQGSPFEDFLRTQQRDPAPSQPPTPTPGARSHMLIEEMGRAGHQSPETRALNAEREQERVARATGRVPTLDEVMSPAQRAEDEYSAFQSAQRAFTRPTRAGTTVAAPFYEQEGYPNEFVR